MHGRVLTPAATVVLVLAAGAAPVAHAQTPPRTDTARSVLGDFAQDGRISACAHSPAALRRAQDDVSPDVEQYAGAYPAEIEAAIEARARGECSGEAVAAPAPTATATPPAVATAPGTAGTVVPQPPAPPATGAPAGTPAPDPELDRAVAATADNDLPLPVVLLGVAALTLALYGLAALALRRRSAVAGGRLGPTGHVWREAAWRAGGTWADFRDWMRLGR